MCGYFIIRDAKFLAIKVEFRHCEIEFVNLLQTFQSHWSNYQALAREKSFSQQPVLGEWLPTINPNLIISLSNPTHGHALWVAMCMFRAKVCGYTRYSFLREWWWPWKGPTHAWRFDRFVLTVFRMCMFVVMVTQHAPATIAPALIPLRRQS